jgi:hypothetical protein
MEVPTNQRPLFYSTSLLSRLIIGDKSSFMKNTPDVLSFISNLGNKNLEQLK